MVRTRPIIYTCWRGILVIFVYLYLVRGLPSTPMRPVSRAVDHPALGSSAFGTLGRRRGLEIVMKPSETTVRGALPDLFWGAGFLSVGM